MIIHGNNIEVLKTFPDNHFSAIVTDPPYGLGKEPDAAEMLKAWLEHGYLEVKGGGFMGKSWDAFVPQPLFWKEAFRVLKPGGHVLSFFGTRTYDWGVMAMRLSGFEIRDCCYWHYGSGFPKSHNISKAMDKMAGAEREVTGTGTAGKGFNKVKGFGKNTTKSDEYTSEWDVTAPATNEAKQWSGWGSALKPASEPIVMARKPLEKGLSIAENILKWGTGGLNIDASRIRFNSDSEKSAVFGRGTNIIGGNYVGATHSDGRTNVPPDDNGRFPANIILTHNPACKCVGLKKVKGSSCSPDDVGKGTVNTLNNGILGKGKGGIITSAYTDENGEEIVEDWECVDDCPVRIMDEQSGISKSSDTKRNRNTLGSFGMPNDETPEYNDKGGASRFFYVAKASVSERNWGLEGFDEKEMGKNQSSLDGGKMLTGSGNERSNSRQNHHPTIKPVKLMQYLIRMITPPGGICLDPFSGSGTTGIACKLEGFEFLGIEMDEEYCKIAESRIENWTDDLETMVIVQQKEEKRNEKKDLSQLDLF